MDADYYYQVPAAGAAAHVSGPNQRRYGHPQLRQGYLVEHGFCALFSWTVPVPWSYQGEADIDWVCAGSHRGRLAFGGAAEGFGRPLHRPARRRRPANGRLERDGPVLSASLGRSLPTKIARFEYMIVFLLVASSNRIGLH